MHLFFKSDSMTSSNILVIDSKREFAKQIGKKNSESDITLYGLKEGEKILTLCEPYSYPDKAQSLLNAIALCSHALLITRELNKDLAECIVALNCSNLPGFIIYDGVSKEELAPFIKDTSLEKYEELENDANSVRMRFLSLAHSYSASPKKALIDSCFAVKGVGTVALGVVLSGSIDVHDDLDVMPLGKKAQIRSIQMHDNDVKSAPSGARLGACLKGVEPEEAGRGNYLCSAGTLQKTNSLTLNVTLSKFSKTPLFAGKILHLWEGMQSTPATVEGSEIKPGSSGTLTLKLHKEIAYEKNSRFLLADYESRPRIIASGTL